MSKFLQNGIEIVSLDAMTARVRLQSPLSAAEVHASEGLQKLVREIGQASQWHMNVDGVNKNDNFNFQRIADVLPGTDDYITVRFRSLSKRIVSGHWIDWSKDNVLKDSVPKLLGATVYPNHDFTDINNWLGVVSEVEWDEAGEQSEGVPGINSTYKIDGLMNPRVARGLLMTPPEIHSTSLTVLLKFEYSHPDIALESKWKFFDLLGTEVDGQIVRMVATEILEYWEASLVFQGADRLAKKQTDIQSFAEPSAPEAAVEPPSKTNEEKTMKLTDEQKAKLGIEFDGEEVPETEIFSAADSLADKLAAVDTANIESLTARAEAGDRLISEKRADVTRLAKIAELGGDDGDLEPVLAEQIAAASVEQLQKLGAYYQKKAADRFPVGGRSSREAAEKVEQAADGVNLEELPDVDVL